MYHLGLRCILGSTVFFALGCRWKDERLRYLNEQSLKLLWEMGGHLPLQCLAEKSHQHRALRNAIFESSEQLDGDIIFISYVILNQVRKIFARPHQPRSWSGQHTDAFAHIMFRQTTSLSGCLAERHLQASLDALHNDLVPKLKLYFKRLKQLLKHKSYSICAWEIVRYEIQSTLMCLNSLIKTEDEAPWVLAGTPD